MKIKTLLLISIIGFYSNIAFADATALCKDGTEYTGKSKRGACRGHDGIKEWYADKAAANEPEPEKKSKSKKSAKEDAAQEESSGPATGLCKDGTETTGKSKRGACRGHDGVKEWYADKEKEESAAKSKSKSKSKAANDEDTAAAPGPVTGLCKDGTETSGINKRSACRGHDGIKEWYADKEKEAPVAKSKAKDDAQPAAASTGAATGMCKDGTEYTGAAKRGACRGHRGLKDWYADSEEKEDQIAAPAAKSSTPYKKADAAEPPARKTQAAPAAGSGQVWVNTNSKIYHCEGSHFYGNTKEGEYMSEAQAQGKGYVANRRKECN